MYIHHVERHADGEELVVMEAGVPSGLGPRRETDPRDDSFDRRTKALNARPPLRPTWPAARRGAAS